VAIYLVRHGLAAADSGSLDPGLAPLGVKQAEATADWLRRTNAGRLVVSPLRRTRETADPVAAALHLEAEVREEVAEVFDPSTPLDERRRWIGPFMAGRWSEHPELAGWRRRVVDTLLEMGLAASAAAHDLVVVSHYVAIGAAIGEAMGDDRVVPVPMANCAITVMEAGHGGLRLLESCSIAHLPPELVTGAHTAMAGRQ
jgi:broad specificity phosphatase PhoE